MSPGDWLFLVSVIVLFVALDLRSMVRSGPSHMKTGLSENLRDTKTGKT